MSAVLTRPSPGDLVLKPADPDWAGFLVAVSADGTSVEVERDDGRRGHIAFAAVLILGRQK